MKQYLIIAHDGNDANALERRMKVRPDHLAGAGKLKENGNYVMGGAILDGENTMRGSVMILQFETEEAFKNWYDNEPYVKGGVWEKIEVKPFRVANV